MRRKGWTPSQKAIACHPGVELRANLKSISHRCCLILVAFAWELTKETIVLPLGCLQGGDDFSNRKEHPAPLKRDGLASGQYGRSSENADAAETRLLWQNIARPASEDPQGGILVSARPLHPKTDTAGERERSGGDPERERESERERERGRERVTHLAERPRQRTSRAVTRDVLLGVRQVRRCDAARPVRAQRNMSGRENQEAESGTLGGFMRRRKMVCCVLRSTGQHRGRGARSVVPCGYV